MMFAVNLCRNLHLLRCSHWLVYRSAAVNVSYREVKDPQFLPEKVSSKVAKDLFERFQEYERVYEKVFAGIFAACITLN